MLYHLSTANPAGWGNLWAYTIDVPYENTKSTKTQKKIKLRLKFFTYQHRKSMYTNEWGNYLTSHLLWNKSCPAESLGLQANKHAAFQTTEVWEAKLFPPSISELHFSVKDTERTGEHANIPEICHTDMNKGWETPLVAAPTITSKPSLVNMFCFECLWLMRKLKFLLQMQAVSPILCLMFPAGLHNPNQLIYD